MTRTALQELGGFDEALGAGILCGGGEDLNVFMRTVLAGHRLVYETVGDRIARPPTLYVKIDIEGSDSEAIRELELCSELPS